MNKLLSILSSISLLITSIPTLALENNQLILDEKEKDHLYSKYATINLDELNLKIGEVNLYTIRNKLDDEKEVTMFLLVELIKNNDNKDKEQEITELIKSIVKNFEDWLITLPQLPLIEGSKTTGNLSMLYLGENNDIVGILNIENISLINKNKNTKYELSNIIRDTDINNISKLNKEILEENILQKNIKYGLKETYFSIQTITYESAIAKATEISHYSGFVIITFDDIFKNIKNTATELAQSDAYNSEQSNFKTSAIELDIDLGKNNFLNSYTYMDYSLNANYYTQGMGRFNYTINQTQIDPKYEAYKNTNHVKPKYKRINLNENTTINTFELMYKNVNQEKTFGTLTTRWLSDFKFEIRLNVNTWVWATAWNAYWARAEASMAILEIRFS
ncbi:hypothetical protein [Spiroplasma cantharicola]|uniref:Uncharacterized protein n=1 Tax=Spiroplasma cantharicola TaxID=362837 RepID=A0A0M4JWJ1_9MOLU|nr:hypothetical protein [Spiroplasma cantharicola]ALD66330.1 hypothetical protein SCANT_v1c04240 [Spiroplasma cantharicola]